MEEDRGISRAGRPRAWTRRVALYGAAFLAAGPLVYGGWIHRPGPDAGTLVSCADLEMRLGQVELATASASAALLRDPHNHHALLIEAHCRTRLGSSDCARERYQQALALTTDPDLAAEIRVALALDARERGAPREAADQLALAAPPHPEAAAKVAYAAGLVAEDLGDREGAIAAHRRALRIAVPDGAIRREAVARLAALGEGEAVLEALGRLGEGGDDDALYLAGRLKFAAGSAEKGADDLRRLGDRSRDALAGRFRGDAGFWQEIRRQGTFPADLEALAANPLGGEERPGQHGMRSSR
jgi:tetratricopeptide (TPR) repeat protein